MVIIRNYQYCVVNFKFNYTSKFQQFRLRVFTIYLFPFSGTVCNLLLQHSYATYNNCVNMSLCLADNHQNNLICIL